MLDPTSTCVVSGLPRSGTSVMMQALAAGGVEPLTDHARPADDDNPRGYYELEAVKRLGDDPAVFDRARGRSIKVIAALIPRLPADHTYRVVFMQRRLDQVLASQRRMLDRLGKPGAALSDERLAAALSRQVTAALEWCRSAPGVRVIEVDYHALCTDPRPVCEAINTFLGGGLDVEAMTATPDPSLYRQRSS